MFSDHKSLKYLFDQKELNMRHRRGLEILKYYDFGLNYHPGKANIVVVPKFGSFRRWEKLGKECSPHLIP